MIPIKRKILLSVLIFLFLGFGSVMYTGAQDIPSTDDLVEGLAATAGFSAGAGHSAPMNTSSFLGLKLGLGATLTTPTDILTSFSSTDALFSSFPIPMTNAYLKLGIPSIDFFLLKNADVGVRVGFIPTIDLEAMGLPLPIELGAFQIGGEFRTALIKLGIFSLDARASFDYNSGKITLGFGDEAGLDVGWSGVSIGLRSFFGLDVNWLFGARVGAGINLNLGEANAGFGLDLGDLGDVSIESTAPYYPFNLRLMGGLKLLIIDVFAEYGILSEQFAVTIMPVTLKF